MKSLRLAACLLLASLTFSFVAWAQDTQLPSATASLATVPRLIRIQGAVHDDSGKPLTGNASITFALYKDETGQQPVWQEIQNVELDSAGHYNVLLGASSEAGLPLEIFSAGDARWLSVRPEGQPEPPRILFLSVAYALKAADTEMLGGKPASAYALAENLPATQSGTVAEVNSSSTQRGPQILIPPVAGAVGQSPQSACSAITSDGTATANQVTKFTSACNIENSAIFESGGNVGIGTTTPAGALDVNGTSFFRSWLTASGGAIMPPVSTATSGMGFSSTPFDLQTSVYNSGSSSAVTYDYRWQTEPVGNDTSHTSATLNLLFGTGGVFNQTGLSVAGNGILTFASGQTFPGASGTVTSVGTGAGLTGGPITTSGTISVPNAGITNAMLANNSVTVTAGSGLSGGGTVALGGTITLTNSAPSLGGTVTSVGSGTGLTGGPITSSGTLSLNTSFTDARYLQLTGGTLTGGLTGTTGTFSGGLSALTGAFSGTVSEAGALLPNTGTATASKGFISNPFDLQTSSFKSTSSSAVTQDFRWQAEPTGNDTANPSGSLNLLFGSNGATPAETGFSIASNGLLSFATGQTFPGTGTGNGTVTSVNTGAGLTGGPITSSGTISIPSAGVTNSMIANPSVTVTAGSGLSGGGTVALGGTITLTNSAPSLGGTVTSVGSGTGLTGGPITGSGTLSLNTSFTDARYLQLSGGTLTGGLTGTTGTFSGGLSALTGAFSGAVSAAGALLPGTGTATASKGFVSNPFDLQASSFNSTSSSAVSQDFRWQAEPTGNDTSNPSGTLNLLFGSNGSTPGETGLSIASNGLINFASGQTFPGSGSGTVTSVNTGAGLTGGPITSSGTISIPSAGVTNTMLANNSVTVTAGSGLSGGGTVALGGTITLTNSAPSLGGTVTSVGSGPGLTGGPITGSGTLSLNTSFTDARYLQLTGGTLTGALAGTSGMFSGNLTAAAGAFTTGTFSGAVSEAGALLPGTGTATATKGFISNPFDLQASSFKSTSSSAVTQDFRWQAEPIGNDTSNPSGSLNLLFGSNGATPAETGFSIASNGLLSFASGQTFPGTGTGNGTVTSVNTGAGLTGGPITSSGTISIPAAGVTNSMLTNNSVTVTAGSGLSGGGTIALGGTVTLTNSAPSLGGTVTSVGSGTGLTGGPITGSGTLSLNTAFTDARYLLLTGGTLTGPFGATSGAFSGLVSEAGALLPGTGTATASQGFVSNPIDLQASAFNSTTSSAVTQDFRWQAEPAGNDSSSPSGSLNLLFGAAGNSPAETGLSIASNGLITFATGQTFPGGGGGGSGTVTQVNTGAGLTGGPITSSGTISIPSAGVTNSMLVNPSITVQAGAGLSGGGTVALGGTITLTNSAPSSGGTVTSVGTGAGILGGPITSSGTLTLDTSFTDARYLQLAGGTLTGGLTGTTASFSGGLGAAAGTFTGPVTEAGAVLPGTGTATGSQGYISNPFDLQASSFNSASSSAVTQDFRWQAEPAGNDTPSPSGSLNLLFGSNGGVPSETGLSIANNGLITFATGQTFPGGSGGGTVTQVNTGAGLTGGPITSSGTISIPAAGVTNTMLANPAITVQAGTGLTGGGTVALGGTVTLASNLSGTTNGIPYFSSPTSLASTSGPNQRSDPGRLNRQRSRSHNANGRAQCQHHEQPRFGHHFCDRRRWWRSHFALLHHRFGTHRSLTGNYIERNQALGTSPALQCHHHRGHLRHHHR